MIAMESVEQQHAPPTWPGPYQLDDVDAACQPLDDEERSRLEVREAQLREAEPMVRRMCRARLGYWDGDDAAQDVLDAVWRKARRPEFEDRGSLAGYAATVARYRINDAYAARERAAFPAGDWDEAWVDEARTPEQQFERDEDVATAGATVGGLLETLTPRQREAVTECALRERDTEDVAGELGLSPSSVRSSQVRAMARMREVCGTRSTNPLSAGVGEYERNRGRWERERAAREAAGETLVRRRSRHLAAREATGLPNGRTLPDRDLIPAQRDQADEPVAQAGRAVARAHHQASAAVAEGQDVAEREARLAAWHTDDHAPAAERTADAPTAVGAA